MSDIVIEHPRWHSQDEVNEIRRGHMEAVARLVARIQQLERENAELLDKVKILEGHLDAAIEDYNEARREALEGAVKVAEAITAPKSIGRDHGRHHEAGAQSAARAIRRLAEQEGTGKYIDGCAASDQGSPQDADDIPEADE